MARDDGRTELEFREPAGYGRVSEAHQNGNETINVTIETQLAKFDTVGRLPCFIDLCEGMKLAKLTNIIQDD